MKRWFLHYGWKFVLAFIVLGFLMVYLVRAEQRASGERAAVPGMAPRAVTADPAPPTAPAAAATPSSGRVAASTSLPV